MSNSIPVHTPLSPRGLALLFHGVGAIPQNMVTLGRAIADAHPDWAVISVASPDPSDLGPSGQGSGYQWFSVRDIDEDSRSQRIAVAMPRFIDCVKAWQAQTGTGAADTTLVGFSQGAIMALEATQAEERLAARVVAFSGRFGTPPYRKPDADIHLIHGDADTVVASAWSVKAHDQLTALGARNTLDIIPGLTHGINAEATRRGLSYLPQT
ncbi:esterase [Asticcacaulis sp. 201]|uniref:esterase n=1 Tax=Asticcacaulis sp. 201 TaxID=3028787 RepID=UPI0029168A4A|nr:esterase [Asticcacaulis sp. 201]MDV6332723.1 esterase [Asticcacaulis sp. 201]